ncbi:hypothetical protein TURU_019112 [Turdus rufiventris]|nr:hypothetical protein TURU_019112 [Turdus rufiventris]
MGEGKSPPDIRSRSSGSTCDLTAEQAQQLRGVGNRGFESGFSSAVPEEVWGGPLPYAPQNGAGREGEGRGEESFPATDTRKREPEGKGEESAYDKGEETPRPNQGACPRTLPFKEGNSPKGRRRRGGRERGQSQSKSHRWPETPHHSTSSSDSDEDHGYSRYPKHYCSQPRWDTKRGDTKRTPTIFQQRLCFCVLMLLSLPRTGQGESDEHPYQPCVWTFHSPVDGRVIAQTVSNTPSFIVQISDIFNPEQIGLDPEGKPFDYINREHTHGLVPTPEKATALIPDKTQYWAVPSASGIWACKSKSVTPCISIEHFDEANDFCVQVVVVPRILYYSNDEVLHHLEENPLRQK